VGTDGEEKGGKGTKAGPPTEEGNWRCKKMGWGKTSSQRYV